MTDLERRAVEVLSEEWARWEEMPTPKDYPKSRPVYERLIAEGWDVPDYALSELWEKLKLWDQIAGAGFLGRDAWREDGNWEFRWVNPDIVDESDDLI